MTVTNITKLSKGKSNVLPLSNHNFEQLISVLCVQSTPINSTSTSSLCCCRLLLIGEEKGFSRTSPIQCKQTPWKHNFLLMTLISWKSCSDFYISHFSFVKQKLQAMMDDLSILLSLPHFILCSMCLNVISVTSYPRVRSCSTRSQVLQSVEKGKKL